MHTLRHGTALFLLFILVILGGAVGCHPAQAQSGEKRRSPRATVQTLFAAVSGSRQNPKFIQDGIACLDLDEANEHERAPDRLVVELEAVLRAAEVNTELIPEEVTGDVYTVTGVDATRVGLRRQTNGRWLFDRETVARTPKMGADARKLLQEKNREAAALNVAPEVVSPRKTFRTFLSAYSRGDTERMLRCFNLLAVPPAARQEVGEQLAHKLVQIILRSRTVIYQDIPDSNYSDAYTWLTSPQGVIELVRMPSGDHKGEWLFSRQTVASIDRLYALVESQPYHETLLSASTISLRPDVWIAPELWLRDEMPSWSRANLSPVAAYRGELYQLLGCLLLLGVALGVNRLGSRALAAGVQRVLALGGWSLPSLSIVPRLRPLARLLACLILRWGFLQLDLDKTVLGYALTVLNPLAWMLGAWAVFRLIDLIGDISQVRMAESKHRVEITEMLWPVGSLATKIVLAVCLILHLMSLFAWDVTAVLTGLGIGGVAFALGAQDSLRNLFGSFTLLADRPFVVGETVQIGGEGVGVVERVGLRSTSIRTVEDTVIVVPNSNLTTMNITNFGRRRFRRFTERIGVVYGTPPERLTAFRDGIRGLIQQEKTTRKDQFEVSIHDLTASSIEIEISVYFDVTTRHEELEARDTLLLGCLRLAEELQVSLAFPTQTLHLVTDSDAGAPPLILHAAGLDEARRPAGATG